MGPADDVSGGVLNDPHALSAIGEEHVEPRGWGAHPL